MGVWVAGVNQRRLGLRGRAASKQHSCQNETRRARSRAAELLSRMRQQPTGADGDGLVCRRERERWSRREEGGVSGRERMPPR